MLGARTSIGKSALALNIGLNVAAASMAVAFFTLEQPADEMWLRALGCEGKVDTFSASRRGLHDDEKERLQEAERKLKALPFEILYRPSMRPRDLRIECRRLVRELGSLKLVIVDYLALMRGNHRERERWREMQEVILALKEIAGELAVPIFLLQQLNRDEPEPAAVAFKPARHRGDGRAREQRAVFVAGTGQRWRSAAGLCGVGRYQRNYRQTAQRSRRPAGSDAVQKMLGRFLVMNSYRSIAPPRGCFHWNRPNRLGHSCHGGQQYPTQKPASAPPQNGSLANSHLSKMKPKTAASRLNSSCAQDLSGCSMPGISPFLDKPMLTNAQGRDCAGLDISKNRRAPSRGMKEMR
jgi:hypothetical protein